MKRKRLKNHFFKQKVALFTEDNMEIKKLDALLTSDELGTTLSINKDNEIISIQLDAVLNKLGLKTECEK